MPPFAQGRVSLGSTKVVSVLRGLLLAVAAFLLISMGGAIFAAPVSLPLLYVAARTSNNRRYCDLAAIVAFFTAAEAAWAVTYIAIGEAKPWIWADPLMGAIGTAAVFTRIGGHTRSIAQVS